jgi:hypothetical protein
MSSSINWTGNKVLDTGSQKKTQQSSAAVPVKQAQRMPSPSAPGATVSPRVPTMPGGTAAQIPPSSQPPRQPIPPSTQMVPPMTQMTPSTTQMVPPSTQMAPPSISGMPAVPMTPGMTREGPPPISEPGYIPYFLRQNIGRNVLAEFIVGTNMYQDKTGIITEVGVNYFVLRDQNFNADVMCDLYSVKFVTILPGAQPTLGR